MPSGNVRRDTALTEVYTFLLILEPAPAATNLRDKERRRQWETAFTVAFVTPVLSVT